jgi:Uma2 family endonuclease
MMSNPSVIPTAPRTSPRSASGSGVTPYRISVRQFEKMIDTGVFGEHDHVELLEGILVNRMTKNEPHNFTVGELAEALRAIVNPDWVVREEKSIVLGRFSRPEPDLAVARGPRERYRSVSPKMPDLGLLVEVADSSYPADRGKRWVKYAGSGIPVYWIVNLPLRQVEVYSEPSGRGKAAAYQVPKVYAPDDDVPVILTGRELGRLKVREILS